MTLAERLARGYPDKPNYQYLWAISQSNMAAFYRALGQVARAETAYRQLIETGTQLTCAHPEFYQVFVGGGAIFAKHQRAAFPASIPDGISNTIVIAEAGTALPWTKPEDMHYAPDEPLPELGGLFATIFNVVMADGSAIPLLKKTDPDVLRAAITCAGLPVHPIVLHPLGAGQQPIDVFSLAGIAAPPDSETSQLASAASEEP